MFGPAAWHPVIGIKHRRLSAGFARHGFYVTKTAMRMTNEPLLKYFADSYRKPADCPFGASGMFRQEYYPAHYG
ncbi:MAG: hypothetical protein WBQ69_07560 [Gallionella sp.]